MSTISLEDERAQDWTLDELPSINDHNEFNPKRALNFVVNNSRSIAPKIYSLIDYFTELNVAAALITETWLKDNKTKEKFEADLKHGYGLDVISKLRGSGKNGGGVSIIFDRTRVNLKNFPTRKNSHEVVAATGKIPNVHRRLCIICAYVPPNISVRAFKNVASDISMIIEKMKQAFRDPLIFLGGDFNRRDLALVVDMFNDIRILETGPTCGSAELDRVATNVTTTKTSVRQPLISADGLRKSDHSVVLVETDLKEPHIYKKKTVTRLQFTEEGLMKFGEELAKVVWQAEYRGVPEEVNAQVIKMNKVLDMIKEKSFKLKTTTIKSTDAPWITKKVKKLIKLRNKYFSKHGPTPKWKEKRNTVYNEIKRAKRAYMKKEEDKLMSPGVNNLAYKAIKNLKSHEKPKQWSVNELRPSLSDGELAEELADFFNQISSEFRPLEEKDVPSAPSRPITMLEPHIVSARMKSAKKSKSMVEGDLFPDIISKYHDLLAIPLTKIFNMARASCRWPRDWKKETVTVIPKGTVTEDFGDCRNLSCTPFFSKVLESFLMDDLNEELDVDLTQFGGVKKCGAEHLLIQAWDRILCTLEDNRASVNLISVDYAKAFNRMSHQECLKAVARKGGTLPTVSLVASFLSGRSMQVKVGQKLSTPRMIHGGSPQGCVTANALFCATIEMLQSGPLEGTYGLLNCGTYNGGTGDGSSMFVGDGILNGISDSSAEDAPYVVPFHENGTEVNTLARPLDEFRLRIHSSPVDRGQEMGFSRSHYSELSDIDNEILDNSVIFPPNAGRAVRARIWDSDDEDLLPCHLDEEIKPPQGWVDEEPWFLKYIDDGLNGEKLCNEAATSHFTTRREIKIIHAKRSEEFFKITEQNAKMIGMRLNAMKTKMLCINVAKNSNIKSYININEHDQITSTETLKMLGFVFDARPNAAAHVSHIRRKFYAKAWVIRHMKSAGTDEGKLVKIYCQYLRPVIEYLSNVYHALLTQELSNEIEKLQRSALRQIFGFKITYEELLKKANVKKLADRRADALTKFARKTVGNPRFESWFPERTNREGLRYHEKYLIKKSNHDRLKNSTLNLMRRILNQS